MQTPTETLRLNIGNIERRYLYGKEHLYRQRNARQRAGELLRCKRIPQVIRLRILYSGSTETALRRAKSAYFAQASANYAVDGRQMQTVTLSMANGQLIMHESEGSFVEPEPEPPVNEEEPEEEPEGQ